MMCRLRSILLLSAIATTVCSASARLNGDDGHYDPLSSSSPPKAHQLTDSYTFERYLVHFNKVYDTPEEYERRSNIFAKNLQKILAHNQGKKDLVYLEGGYVMGVNAFTDVETSELPMGYDKSLHPAWRSQIKGISRVGVASKTERLLDDAHAHAHDDAGTDTYEGVESYSQPPDFEIEEISSLPKSIDWSALGKVNPTVPNQHGCGSCWTFASTAVIESHLAIATGEDVVPLSEQEMLQCSPDPDHCGGKGECSGSTVELGLNYIADRSAKKTGGMYALKDVPYSSSKDSWVSCEEVAKDVKPSVGITGWTALESNNYKVTMNALAKVGPLAVAVAADGWSRYEKGVFDTEATVANHAVLLVGYGEDEETGEKFWKIRNSWGSGFGEDGYIRIKRTDDDDNVCGMDTDPLVGTACALDDNGNTIDVQPVKVCGTGAVLFDPVYPVGAFKIEG